MADTNDITRLTELLIGRQDQQQQQIDLLVEKIAKTDNLVEVLAQVQNKLVNQLELIYTEQRRFNRTQEKFNDRQEKANERQDQFNIIFLDEIRGLKKDVKMLIEVVMQRHEERLKRPEDFMDGFLRKAG